MHLRLRRIARGNIHPFTLALCLSVTGCSRAMHDDGRAKPLEASAFLQGKQLAPAPVKGTVARDAPAPDDPLFSGISNGIYVTTIPLEANESLFHRGQQRYEIYCAPCHDSLGAGNGMIVQRGFKKPLPFTAENLRAAPPGYFFEVISKGVKTMYPMASQISVKDRWAIVAYVRVLQRSQHASIDDVPNDEQKNLEAQ